jgi:hypothetical protein
MSLAQKSTTLIAFESFQVLYYPKIIEPFHLDLRALHLSMKNYDYIIANAWFLQQDPV